MREQHMGFRVGDRIQMEHCADPYAPIAEGERGTIQYIDDMGTLHMAWDNGRSLGVCLDEDRVSPVGILEEFRNFDARSTMDCPDDDVFEEHAEKAAAAVSMMEACALEAEGAWVVRRTCIDHGHASKPASYDYVAADGLHDMLQGADVKNGVDVGHMKAGRTRSFAMIAYGQGYTETSTGRDGFVTEAFECRLLAKETARDFEERLDAGWSSRGEGPRKMFFAHRDQQSLARPIARCKDLFGGHRDRGTER